MDAIDLEIVSAFGPFIKFIIGDRSTTTTVPGPSVFEVLMSAQRITSLPKRIENAKMCGMWRLVYATKKLTKAQQKTLMSALDGMSFSCGSPLQDLEMDHELKDTVFVRNMNCCDSIEILYYTAENEPICIHCGQLEPFSNDISYPQCDSCKDKPAISKK